MPHWSQALSSADWSDIPDPYRHPLRFYVEYGKVPGPFLTALLAGDSHEVILRADRKLTLDDLRHMVLFCDRFLPAECFGRAERVAAWEEFGGFAGLARMAETGTI